MAKHTITHTCGHQIVHNLSGKSGFRQWKKNQLESEICAECWKAARAEVAAAKTADAGLVELGGTEKQIAWANTIRLEKLAEIDKMVAEIKAVPASATEKGQRNMAKLDEVVAAIRGKESARWWIDARYEDGRRILSETARQMKVEFER